jgi:hypothetical protein
VVVAVADQAELLEGLHDLEAVGADRLVHAVVAERVGGPDHVLAVAATHAGEGVDDAEVGIDAEAGDEEHLAAAVVGVEVAPVVEVAVAAGGVRQRQRGLVQRVLVDGDGRHGDSPGLWGLVAIGTAP